MRYPRFSLSIVFLIVLVLGCERRLCGCMFPSSPLAGEWKLTRITYGLTQKVATTSEISYTESLSFDGTVGNGTYRQIWNRIPAQTSPYSLSFPNGGDADGVIYYESDSTQQSFKLSGNFLYLSEKSPRNATINDGSTYEYKKQ